MIHFHEADPRYLPDPPGLPHHPNCPCCETRRQLEWAIRTVDGMRGARIGDDLILAQLRREKVWDHHIERALGMEEGALG